MDLVPNRYHCSLISTNICFPLSELYNPERLLKMMISSSLKPHLQVINCLLSELVFPAPFSARIISVLHRCHRSELLVQCRLFRKGLGVVGLGEENIKPQTISDTAKVIFWLSTGLADRKQMMASKMELKSEKTPNI